MDVELARARNEVVRLARAAAVGDLVATMARELSHPLAAIRHDAEAALRWLGEDPGQAKAREALEGIVTAATGAAELVQRARRAAGRGAVDRRPVAIGALAEDVARLLSAEASARRVAIAVDAPDDLPPVLADPAELRTVLAHLVASALESAALGASPRRRGAVALRAREEDGGVRVEVADSGPGLPPEALALAFEPLPVAGVHAGGVGLALCRAVCEAHGGSLAVAASGGGASVTLTLPSVARPRERS